MDILTLTEKFKNVSKSFGSGEAPKFGIGDPDTEKEKCETINLFMICHAMTQSERRRIKMDKHTTLREARKHFGRDINQNIMTDEHDFRFNESDLDRPLYEFSKGCNLNLNFHYPCKIQDVRKSVEKNVVPALAINTMRSKDSGCRREGNS